MMTRIDSAVRRAINRDRQVAPPRRRVVLPRQVPPTGIEREYGNALDRILQRAFDAYIPLFHALPGLLDVRADAVRVDAPGDTGRRVQRLVKQAAEHTRKAIHRPDLEDLARKVAGQTSTHQRAQLSRQVRSVLGADPVLKEPKLAESTQQFIHENASLIVRIPEQLHGDVEALVQRAVSSSMPSPKLAEHIQKRFGVSKRHARLIARDQVSKLNGKLNRHRQHELGIEKFQWDSVGDERVRDWHREELDGNIYRFDKPPLNEDGEHVYPGDDIQCRCSATPVIE